MTLDAFSKDTGYPAHRSACMRPGHRLPQRHSKRSIELLLEKLMKRRACSRNPCAARRPSILRRKKKVCWNSARITAGTIDFYTADELAEVPGDFSASEMVKSVTGVDNVCERSAALKSGGEVVVKKMAENGVTMAVAMIDYRPTWEWKQDE